MRGLVVGGISLLALALLSIAGCPTPGGGGTSQLIGTWSGTLDCTTTQSLGGVDGAPRDSEEEFTITFDDGGRPEEVTIWGFSGADNVVVQVQRTGDSDVVTQNEGERLTSVTATVRSAAYTTTTARLIIDIEYQSSEGSLNQEGTAVLDITARLTDAGLSYTADIEYDIEQRAGSVTLQTGERQECTGTLTKEAEEEEEETQP